MINPLDYLDSDQLTVDLRDRLRNNTPYVYNVFELSKPFEPYVKVIEKILPYDNNRSFEKEGFVYIPIATYVNGCRKEYTLFDECEKWALMYGIDNVFIGVISELMNNNN